MSKQKITRFLISAFNLTNRFAQKIEIADKIMKVSAAFLEGWSFDDV